MFCPRFSVFLVFVSIFRYTGVFFVGGPLFVGRVL